jgi:hypothetical protein
MPEVEAKPAEDAPVRVAKISALQAIVVAVITAAAGVFAGYIGKSSTQAPPPQQRWIVIDGAESQAYSVVRIVATINGVHFSYPSNSVWAEVGPSMSRERFPIPTADRYTVSFRAFLSNPGPSATLSGEANYVESISEVPSGERTYSLYQVSNGYRGASPVLRVRYHVE